MGLVSDMKAYRIRPIEDRGRGRNPMRRLRPTYSKKPWAAIAAAGAETREGVG